MLTFAIAGDGSARVGFLLFFDCSKEVSIIIDNRTYELPSPIVFPINRVGTSIAYNYSAKCYAHVEKIHGNIISFLKEYAGGRNLYGFKKQSPERRGRN